jgi:hypothetical protein
MRAVPVVLALVLGAACHDPRPSWAVSDYVRAGMPTPTHAWSTDELVQATRVLATVTRGRAERLPHFHDPGSGAVFDHFVARAPADDPKGALGKRIGDHLARYQAINTLSHLYAEVSTLPRRETIEIWGALIAEATILDGLADPFLATFPPDDVKLAVRRDGMAKMRHGYGTLLFGALTLAGDDHLAVDDRIALLGYVAEGLRAIFDHLRQDDRQAIVHGVKSLVANTTGPLHDEALRIQAVVR